MYPLTPMGLRGYWWFLTENIKEWSSVVAYFILYAKFLACLKVCPIHLAYIGDLEHSKGSCRKTWLGRYPESLMMNQQDSVRKLKSCKFCAKKGVWMHKSTWNIHLMSAFCKYLSLDSKETACKHSTLQDRAFVS